MSDLTFDDVVGWLQAHQGDTIYLEIGEPDPDHEGHDALYAMLHGVTLGEVLLGEDTDLGCPAAVVIVTNLGERSRLIFDPARFDKAKSHGTQAIMVWMHNAYLALGT